jgi:hypothetical protein
VIRFRPGGPAECGHAREGVDRNRSLTLRRTLFEKIFLGERSPLLVRRGGRDIKKMWRSLLVGADGVIGQAGV